MITVLSGGVGAARLLRVLRGRLGGDELTAVVNVGDDFTLYGLTICPDLDTVTYTLAGRVDALQGWGQRDESWTVRDGLVALGDDAWFRLGDRDLATHLYRSRRLGEGATKTAVSDEIARALGVDVRVLPATDDPVATTLTTSAGVLSFQDYFVRHRHAVAVSGIDYAGADRARPGPDVVAAIARADRVVLAPSNPLLSLAPIFAVPGVRGALAARQGPCVAVSPLVGGRALKGPADRLLGELGHAPATEGVAEIFGDLVDTWVIDEADASDAARLRARGFEVRVTTTVMGDPEREASLATAVLA